MPDQCYFGEDLAADFYQCATPTTPGESPTSAPSKWRKIRLLAQWRFVLAQLTYANLLRLDGQTEKATLERSEAYKRESSGLDDLIRAEAQHEENQRRHCRPGMVGPRAAGGGYVAAGVVLDDAYRLMDWDVDQLEDRSKGDARMALSQALQEVWERWWWRQLMICAQTRVALAWNQTIADGDGYSATATVYWPATDAYYTALENDLDTDPADSDGETNDRWYKFTANPPTLDNYDATATYTYGDQVQYAGRQFEAVDASFTDEPPPIAGGRTDYWSEINIWKPTLPFTDVADDSVNGPFGPIRSVSTFDPRNNANPVYFDLNLTADGTRIEGLNITFPWVWSRRVTPVLTGDAFDAAEIYTASDAAALVFDS